MPVMRAAIRAASLGARASSKASRTTSGSTGWPARFSSPRGGADPDPGARWRPPERGVGSGPNDQRWNWATGMKLVAGPLKVASISGESARGIANAWAARRERVGGESVKLSALLAEFVSKSFDQPGDGEGFARRSVRHGSDLTTGDGGDDPLKGRDDG